MNIREFYKEIGSDYREVEKRFGAEALVTRFVSKFTGDPTFGLLEAAFAAGDQPGAFRAAHTLKGVSSNLGFGRLWQTSSELTEYLRPGNAPEGGRELFEAVREEYGAVLRALKNLTV